MILKTGILIFSVICCGLLVIALKIRSGTNIKFLLSFSGAYILSLCLFHLIPELYTNQINPNIIGWSIVSGFLMQIMLDYISGGIEHGHIHNQNTRHEHKHEHEHEHEHGNPGDHHMETIEKTNHPVINKFPVMMMIGLCIHAFMEGLPLFMGGDQDSLFIGIILHNIPISITLTLVFLMAGKTVFQCFSALFIFASMTPAGAILSWLIFPVQSTMSQMAGQISLGIVIGIFLHISTTILFESDKNHRFNLAKLITVLAGILTAFLIN